MSVSMQSSSSEGESSGSETDEPEPEGTVHTHHHHTHHHRDAAKVAAAVDQPGRERPRSLTKRDATVVNPNDVAGDGAAPNMFGARFGASTLVTSVANSTTPGAASTPMSPFVRAKSELGGAWDAMTTSEKRQYIGSSAKDRQRFVEMEVFSKKAAADHAESLSVAKEHEELFELVAPIKRQELYAQQMAEAPVPRDAALSLKAMSKKRALQRKLNFMDDAMSMLSMVGTITSISFCSFRLLTPGVAFSLSVLPDPVLLGLVGYCVLYMPKYVLDAAG